MGRRLEVLTTSRSAVPVEVPARPAWFSGMPPLVDTLGRKYVYLRLSVTDRCDLACQYCMPPGGEVEHAVRPDVLTFEEAARIVAVFAAMGVRRVRLTGGEPLVRKDVLRLVQMIATAAPLDSTRVPGEPVEIVLSTNATRLSELAQPLRDAGLAGVNVSIDSLDRDRFREITRGGDLGRVLAGIHAAASAGLELKLNTVLMRGVNDDELEKIVRFAFSIGATPRFIELMPLGEGSKLPPSMFLSARDAIASMSLLAPGEMRAIEGRGPARYLEADGGRVGFITAMTESFCGGCNRVRLTARGDIRACLADRRAVSLRDVIRAGHDDQSLAYAIHYALMGKDVGHHFTETAVSEHEHVGMSLIGG